ncbi:alpha-L-fucosidase 1 isoform X1 [Neltuma alba]|uniref:alpha-L-fucosidase 1 isoform X1 n=1 Tax=Neltuma alba TaxID=207710 RepID=UPI0010A2F576|nr:alpha-L-fucosidase 1 isoform X1 [Prosopis alba]
MKKKARTFSCTGHHPQVNISDCLLPIFQIPAIILLLAICFVPSSSSSTSNRKPAPPPLPILPIPNAFQLQWQLGEMALFLHFGMNTFTDSEWGTGRVNPSVFNPSKLNATQWVRVAKEYGFSRILLTAKHHDGFCLWPSDYTDYSVRASKWRNGTGDVVAELAAAAMDAGIGLGLYLSPWDRHEPCYGKTLEYNEHYLAQMTELLTRYGEIKNVFLDGAKGKGEKDMKYLFEGWFSLIHQLQPGALIFSDAGPDTRWIGDEAGVAGSTCWSIFNKSAIEIGDYKPQYSGRGDPFGHDWVPAECDVSIRHGWFWHASEVPKSARTLLDIYYKSVGRNCHLLLNLPPNSSGLISDEDIQVLQEFSDIRSSIFSHNLALNALLRASSTRGGTQDFRFSPYNVLEEGIQTYWAPGVNQSTWVLYIDLQRLVSFNVVKLQEPIQMGQRVIEFHLETLDKGVWKRVANGTTIGYQRLLRFPELKSQRLKLQIDKSRAEPLIAYFGIYMDRVSISSDMSDGNLVARFNGSQVVRSATQNYSQVAAT